MDLTANEKLYVITLTAKKLIEDVLCKQWEIDPTIYIHVYMYICILGLGD